MFSLFIAAAAMMSPPPITVEIDRPRYFFILFGGQSLPFRPHTAHTFATFVQVLPSPSGAPVVETITISWLPDSGKVRPWRPFTQRGRNYTLEETFAVAQAEHSRISMWGPFEIDAAWYARAAEQAAHLASGEVRYRVLDSFGFNTRVQHCVRAVVLTDTIRQFRLQPVIQVGEPGTARLAKRYLRRGVLNGSGTHDWVIPLAGVDAYPVVRRAAGEHVRRSWRGEL